MKRNLRIKQLLALALSVSLVFSTNITPVSAAKKTKTSNMVKSIKVVSPAGSRKIATVAKGKSIKLAVTVKARKKAFRKVTFKSTNPKVAKVSRKGIVKGKKVGTATIKVISKKNTKRVTKIKIRVVKNAVKNITLNKNKLDLSIGASEKLNAKITAPKKAYKAVKWTSSNTNAVRVSNKGVINAIGEGTAKITVTALDGSKKKDECIVSVWNGIKDMQINNPRRKYFVDSYKVTLYEPTELKRENFIVKSKVYEKGAYNRETEVKKIFTNDNVHYTLFTNDDVEMGRYVQISIPSLKGRNVIEKQVLSEGVEYKKTIAGTVGDEIDEFIYFNNLIGFNKVSITSGNLPTGLKIKRATTAANYIEGKVTAVANNQVVNLMGTDELGRKANSKYNFLIGDKNTVVAENITIGNKSNALIYPHHSICAEMHVVGGSGKYRATLLDRYNNMFYLNNEMTDDNGNKYTTVTDMAYINSRLGKLEAGTYNLRVRFTDMANPTLKAVGTLTVIVTPAVSVTTLINNFERCSSKLMFYNHDLNETFSAFYEDEKKDFDKKLFTSKEYLPAGNYSVYLTMYGEEIPLAKYINLNKDTTLSYTMPIGATITGMLKDKSGTALDSDSVYVAIYKTNNTNEFINTVSIHNDGKYEFKCVPKGNYIIKVFDHYTLLAASRIITVTGTNVFTIDFLNLQINNN